MAPYGWHVPSDKEWGLLTNYLGGGWVAGGKLKEAGTNHWNIPNVGGTNESGFTALPGGCRGIEGFFYGYGDNSSWWQPSDTTNILCLFLSFSDNYVRWSSNNKELGIFVRCIKD
ncbi:MAG: hypothetical protein HW421_957 [Ignavibacteria bacterium]|nr:hypothetical protein [Ignavibacteria bacterium]